jgi:hypothetical protein
LSYDRVSPALAVGEVSKPRQRILKLHGLLLLFSAPLFLSHPIFIDQHHGLLKIISRFFVVVVVVQLGSRDSLPRSLVLSWNLSRAATSNPTDTAVRPHPLRSLLFRALSAPTATRSSFGL